MLEHPTGDDTPGALVAGKDAAGSISLHPANSLFSPAAALTRWLIPPGLGARIPDDNERIDWILRCLDGEPIRQLPIAFVREDKIDISSILAATEGKDVWQPITTRGPQHVGCTAARVLEPPSPTVLHHYA